MRAISFLNYFLKARGRHGTHSPYVYELVDYLHRRERFAIWEDIERVRKRALRSSVEVDVHDLGTGKSGRKPLSEIARKSATGKAKGRLLSRLSAFLDPQCILELGTNIGLGAAYLSAGKVESLTTVEGCPNTLQIARENFESLGIGDKIDAVNTEFDEAIATHLQGRKYDLIFIDGNHTYDATMNFSRKLPELTREEGVWIFDDIRWSGGMWNAWKEIVESDRFPVTIDFGLIGVAMFRKGQAPQHFTLRFW